MSDPCHVNGPAIISFSGGRTSAYLLYRILQSHSGVLPPDVLVVFANTGKERPETLRFVHECATRWCVQVHWVEWRDSEAGFEIVGYNSASRDGAPFAALIAKRGYLPNAVTRFCTYHLKVQTMAKFARSQGFNHWINVIGLRYDEGHRVLKALARNDSGKDCFTAVMPLSKAKISKRDIKNFWLGDNADPLKLTAPIPHGFDLGLRNYEGNCDYCFLKSRKILERTIRDGIARPDWWIEQERLVTARARPSGARFVTEYSYADLVQDVHRQPLLIDDDLPEFDVECGLACAPLEEVE